MVIILSRCRTAAWQPNHVPVLTATVSSILSMSNAGVLYYIQESKAGLNAIADYSEAPDERLSMPLPRKNVPARTSSIHFATSLSNPAVVATAIG